MSDTAIEPTPSTEVAVAEPSLVDYADQGFDANAIPVERLGDIIVAGAMLSKFVKACESRALQAMERGVRIPGLKLVRGRSARKVVDPDGTLAGELVARGLIDAMQPKTITNLAPVLKRAVHDGVVDADFKAHVEADYVMRQPGNIVVAPDSDPRAELPIDPATGMYILEQPAEPAKAEPKAEPKAEGKPKAKAKSTRKRKTASKTTSAANDAVTNVAEAHAEANAVKAAEATPKAEPVATPKAEPVATPKAEPVATPKAPVDGVDADALFGPATATPSAKPIPAPVGPSVTNVGADLGIDIEALLD